MSESLVSLNIEVRFGDRKIHASLNESPLCKRLYTSLPIEGMAKLWGQEMYLTSELNLPPEELHEVVNRGDVCWWAPGSALCFFWGPTPASIEEECRPASAVSIIGKVREEDLPLLAEIRENEPLVIRKLKTPLQVVASAPAPEKVPEEGA